MLVFYNIFITYHTLAVQKEREMERYNKYFLKYLNTNLDHSPHRNKNELIQGIRQLAYFRINTGNTLGKLRWKSKVSLQRNGMAAIPKNKSFIHSCIVSSFGGKTDTCGAGPTQFLGLFIDLWASFLKFDPCIYFWNGSHALPLQRGMVFTQNI